VDPNSTRNKVKTDYDTKKTLLGSFLMPNRHWHFYFKTHKTILIQKCIMIPHDRVYENIRYSMTSQTIFPHRVKVSLAEERVRSGIGMDMRRRLSRPSFSHIGNSCLCASVFRAVVATEVEKTGDVADKRVTVVDMLCGRSHESTGQNVGLTVC